MATLTLTLLGSFQVALDGAPITGFRSDKVRALLAYLAVEADRPHTRASLCGLLWPDQGDDAALHNLSQTLLRLRQTLGAADVLQVTRQTIQWHAQSGAQVDLTAFVRLARSADRTDLERAAALYGGPFLPGFSLPDCPEFDEWLMLTGEHAERLAVTTLETLARTYLAAEAYGEAERAARRLLALDPWRESAHLQVMQALAGAGQRSAALAQYEACRRVLAEELGLEPSPELAAFAAQLRAAVNTAKTSATPTPAVPAPRHDLRAIPAVARLYGRADELACLEQWLVEDRCRVVAVLGMGGVGKTALAATAVQAVADRFECVIWRSLLNAPPFEELLRPVLQSVSGHTLANLPAGLDDQLALVLDVLRQQRCLLVLDNLESILQPDPPGTMYPGYEGYAQLLRAAAERPHQSCVLLTSRERPQGLARWEADLPGVRALRLEGLDAASGQAILAARGLTGQAGDARVLVERYSGHPLALKLVAQTVHELFGGAIAAFLHEEPLIFDDIRAVLDQQFARLAPLEQEIMTWLAIEREPLTLPALRADLLQPGAPRDVVKALRALQRRSLLEPAASAPGAAPAGAAFTLQNVIMEYVTDRLVEDAGQEIAGGRLDRLHRYALLKAQAKEYVRQSQARLILQPVAAQVLATLGETGLVEQVRRLLAALRAAPAPGYAAGNLLNLVLQAGVAMAGYDFSRLCVWQADLRGVVLATLNLAHADLSTSAFTVAFDVEAITFDEAGQLLVAGIVEGDICVWRAAAGQLHHGFRSPASNPANSRRTIVFSRDGQLLASSVQDFAVRLWSVANGDRLHTLPGHTNELLTLAFSADGRRLASSSRDGTIRVWDVPRGQLLHILYEHAAAISALAFSPDGALLAGGGGEQIICLWDAHGGQVVKTLRGHAREIECLAFSADGRLLASGAHDGTIRLWDVAADQPLCMLHGHSQIVRSIVLHPDGQHLASGGADRLVRLWDLRTGQALLTLYGHALEVKSVAFSPDGQILASASVDPNVKLWDTRTGYALDAITGHTNMVRSIRFSPDGQRLASSGADGLVRLWDMRARGADAATRGQIAGYLQGHVGEIRSVAFSPDGRLVASGGVDQTVRVWDVATGRAVRILRGHTSMVKALAFGPDGRVLASGGSDRTIRLWPVAGAISGQRERVLRGHEDDISSLAFSPDGRTLLSSSLDHTARLWALDGGQELRVLRGQHSTLSGAVFTPDGQLVVATDYSSTVYVWEVGSGRRRECWHGPMVAAVCVFSPDGETLASVAPDQAIEIRQSHTGALLHRLYGHSAQVLSLDFSPTEPILASSSWDGAIHLWDLRTGASLATLRAPGPYAGVNITGVTGITDAQWVALRALGAIEEP